MGNYKYSSADSKIVISINKRKSGSGVALIFTNTGEIVDNFDDVFSPFRKINKSKGNKSIGIGLWNVKNAVVQILGGKIIFEQFGEEIFDGDKIYRSTAISVFFPGNY